MLSNDFHSQMTKKGDSAGDISTRPRVQIIRLADLAPGLNKKVLNIVEQEIALQVRSPSPIQFSSLMYRVRFLKRVGEASEIKCLVDRSLTL